MAANKGAIPKVRKPLPFGRSTKTPRSPPQQQEQSQNDSIYPCEKCEVTDDGDKVLCDRCLRWYHFTCVNVTSEVEKLEQWLCDSCVSKNQALIPSGDAVGSVHDLVSLDDPEIVVENIPSKENTQLPPNANQSAVNQQRLEQKTTKSNKSRKSASIASSTSRKAALALQRLEEERQLREQREIEDRERRDKSDKEYLDQKYSILEDFEEDSECSDDVEDLNKLELVKQWADLVQFKNNQPPLEISDQKLDNKIHSNSEPRMCSTTVCEPDVSELSHPNNSTLKVANTPVDMLSTSTLRLNTPSCWSTNPGASIIQPPSAIIQSSDANIHQNSMNTQARPTVSNIQSVQSVVVPVQSGSLVSTMQPVASNPEPTSMGNPYLKPFQTLWERALLQQPIKKVTHSNMGSSSNAVISSSNQMVYSSNQMSTTATMPPHTSSQAFTSRNQTLTNNHGQSLPINNQFIIPQSQYQPIQLSSQTTMPQNLHVPLTGSNQTFLVNSQPVAPSHHSTLNHQANTTSSWGQQTMPSSQSVPIYSSMSSRQANSANQSFLAAPNNYYGGMGNSAGNMSMSGIHEPRGRLTREQIASRQVIDRKLPIFYGNPEEWDLWYNRYLSTTTKCNFDNSENLDRLEKCLKGRARDLVKSRLSNSESLQMIFGRPETVLKSSIKKIRDYPAIKSDNLESLINFAFEVQSVSKTIESLGCQGEYNNPMLIDELTDKLPPQEKKDWARFKRGNPNVTISTLSDWLYELAGDLSTVVEPTVVKYDDKKQQKTSSSKSYLNTQVEKKSKQQDSSSTRKTNKCLACKSESCSKVSTCKKFKEWSRPERWTFVKENKLCSRCLGGHSFYRCRSNQDCKAEGCTKKHHTLLHGNEKAAEVLKNEKNLSVPENKTNEEIKITTSVCNSQRSINNRTDIFRIVPVVLYNNHNVVCDFAYLDDGSNLTLMENGLADELGLVGTPQAVCIDWAFGQSHESEESRIVTTKISGVYYQAPKYKLENVRTVNKLHLPTQSLTSTWLKQYPHLKTTPIVTYEAAKPRMLIGLQYSKLIVSMATVESSWEEPIACRTRLGWVVQGPSFDDSNQIQRKFSLNLCECQSNDNQLHQLVKEYFSVENFGVKLNDKYLESKEVQRARQILESTTVKNNGRYESGLLWKFDQIELPNSYNMALKRLQCLESKMTRNPQLAENLCNQIKQFVDKGYIKKLSSSELQIKHDREWYLPIFPVFNPKKPEKVRIVWDAAAKVKNVSLNSMLLTGPDLLVPLVDVLRRFRERSIAILADIREMYHQIKIVEKDQNVQRFLWRDGDQSKKPEIYVMLVSTFGAACSPCTAQFVKNKNANEFKPNFPEAVAAITNNTYVDDLLDCVHKFEEAVKLVGDVKYVNQQGGFDTRNFLSNSKELLRKIGERTVQQSKNLNINNDLTLGTERILGMFWNAETDNFTYSLKYTKVNENVLSGAHHPTKREVLRILMSIFDPLGLLASFLVYAKILLQEIWRSNIDWDEQITTIIRTKWLKWITALPEVENIQIPRLYSLKLSPRTPNSIQLHVFVDASVEAFAAAAYLRIEDDDGIDCCLVGAKTKVASNKPMSVPRLELQAGVLGTRLSGSIKTSQRLNIEKVVYWSDSKTVMGWINSEARRYHQFVAFRIGEILESTDSKEWRWVPSEHNVADAATKSKEIQRLDSSSRWFKGPKFLYDEESTWFTEENGNEHYTEEEMRPGFVMSCRQRQKIHIVDFKKFTEWDRLVRSVAYVFRFIYNVKTKNRHTGPLLQEEIIKAENHLYGIAQRDHYLDEIVVLEQNAKVQPDKQKYLEKSSELYTYSPYLDDHGVLRVKGRIDAAKCLSQETKRPIILPRRHHITKLIVDHYHRRYLHLNHQTALNEIKRKYDIPALRVVMKEVRNSCQRCKNDSAVPQIPEMAELPLARLSAYERPYTFVGIDYFGPFKVKITRNCSASRWGVLFTCLTTRAIHLEVAHSLNTSSCIMAVERFNNDCGTPREFYSDNGTNFHGMDNELKEEFKKLNQDEIQETFTNSEMKWSFNPPASPHMGGAWERLIRTVKSCFKKIVTTRKPTDETLPTLFAQVENIVNSRPLTYVVLDSSEDEALTPNHFLFGSSNGRKPLCNTSPRDLNKDDWKNIQEQTNQFWRRFVLEYMPTLTKRTKWFKQSKPVQVGDIVLIIDETNPRNTWPKGIIEQTFVGKGGKRRQAIVRVVVETKNGPVHKQYRRAVHKLAILDVKVPANEEVKRQPVESINGGETVEQH